MIILEKDKGIPRRVLLMMAAMAGITVANCYYNQPLLEMIRSELGISQVEANMITVITQVGYALGLFFVIPLGDLCSRRNIVTVNMLTTAAMAVVISVAGSVWQIWLASLVMGACSVTPQLFMPMAGQYSLPAHKVRNIGYVLSGLLTGILASRVVSGFVGDWLGWRAMFVIAAVLMVACLAVTQAMMPTARQNFSGTWVQLMRSVLHIVATSRRVRLYSIRAAFGMGSMLAVWSCLAFRLAAEPFRAGADMVGVLGLCGIFGAVSASGLGRFVPRCGIRRFSLSGAALQIAAWGVAWWWGGTYGGLVAAVIMVDIGLQCLQLANQSGCLDEMPEASSRVNTVFMTTHFIGGSLGTFFAGLGWHAAGWDGVCAVGALFAAVALAITALSHD